MPRNNLNWKNLRQNRCPQCGRNLDIYLETKIECVCSFRISPERMKNIVNDMNLRDFEKEENKIADDFLEGFGREN